MEMHHKIFSYNSYRNKHINCMLIGKKSFVQNLNMLRVFSMPRPHTPTWQWLLVVAVFVYKRVICCSYSNCVPFIISFFMFFNRFGGTISVVFCLLFALHICMCVCVCNAVICIDDYYYPLKNIDARLKSYSLFILDWFLSTFHMWAEKY